MNDKFIKVTYESEPIGREQIVLYLTTFDIEAFKKDEALKKIPTKREIKTFSFDKGDLKYDSFVSFIEEQLGKAFNETYLKQLNEMKTYIEYLKSNTNIKSLENATNCDSVICEVVKGNIVNCDIVHCQKVEGNVVNCDKIVGNIKGE